ncbi:hypothetical protein BDQ17DRAFT_1331424 [Cyathus striatus]|nr:hypothetical protein BDQ17DRAFT_1331424 [Cyathus striatus]
MYFDKNPKRQRTLDGERMCTGVNFSTTKWLSIPVIMMLSVDEECFVARHQKPLVWNFPKEIRPDGNSVTYEMVSRIFYGNNHFNTHFAYNKKVYEYDGMKGGVGKELLNSSPGTELYGLPRFTHVPHARQWTVENELP